MNNLFEAFTIEIPGANLDDKYFYEYSDFSTDNIAVPTEAQSIAKAKAYIRMKQIKRKLSELAIPVYFTVSYGTAGSASAVPVDATLTVGYISYQPFISTLNPVPVYTTDADAAAGAAAVIKEIIDTAMNQQISDEFAITVHLYDKVLTPFNTTEDSYRELQTVYLTADAVTVSSTVTHIQL